MPLLKLSSLYKMLSPLFPHPPSKHKRPLWWCTLFTAQGFLAERDLLAQMCALFLTLTKAPYRLAASIHSKSFYSSSTTLSISALLSLASSQDRVN